MNFLEKLDLLMDRYGLNKRSLSQKSGIPYTTIDAWYKKGYEGLKLTTLRKLNEYFNTTLDFWILDEVIDPNYGKTSGFKVDYNEMEHIKKYRNLDDYGRETIDIALERESARVQQLTDLQSRPAAIIGFQERTDQSARIAEYFRSASAGGGVFILGNEATSKIMVPESDWDDRVDFVISISGHSMEPDYNDGDKVMVSQRMEMCHGDVGIFVINGKAYIKEYGEKELISRNPNSENIKISEYDNIVCMGKVIGKLEGQYEIIDD